MRLGDGCPGRGNRCAGQWLGGPVLAPSRPRSPTEDAFAVLRADGNVALYSAAGARGTGPRLPRNLDVQGNIAIYTTSNAGVLHAVNLTTGKDRALSDRHGGVDFAHIDSAGLVYASNGSGKTFGKATLVFKPLSLVKAAVG
jgi:hypothetical protein